MSTEEYILIFGGLFVALCFLLVCLNGRLQKIRQEKRRKNVIRQMLQTAQEQNEIFDLKVLDNETNKKGLSATLLQQDAASLDMEVLAYVSKEWTGTPVDVYFRVSLPEGPIFYKFRSAIQTVEAGREKSRIGIAAPTDLEVGQKRNFIRVKPHKEAVRVIGVWSIEPGRPIPRTTGEIGRPVMHYKLGMKNDPLQVENVSATGMALRFQMEDAETRPVDLDKGSQLLCLVIYAMDKKGEKLVTFWCTCEVINARTVEGPAPALILGVEFTNWAVLEQGKAEIHWFHSSPSRGVGPITQWVMRMDMEQRKLL